MTETICEIAAQLCAQVVQQFEYYWNNAIVQGTYEYWDYPQKSDYTITLHTQPSEVEKILRAFYGFDCYLQLEDNSEICIIKGVFQPMQHTMPFGTPVAAEPDRRGYAVTGGIVWTPVYEREHL